ncbi:hypothetical protein A3C96_01370 [Candidatus Uhrbacteria bacterium RIFCSPHIGHO2_02_FULL_60_10]|uniref:Uncharacterized protein n=1 Tax=Candidatus Uhrbacteria bacterium RIFCSPHIGHO2_02_FULL_60_10 TaxID=1802392 RepID=A0A1F7U607_9BACT|nr:MAG: hypothetical protein A3C96_01370 [Candidatus Uhrbacteria bacterium RIFCSPHIGHO2_02_FULL_60_10]
MPRKKKQANELVGVCYFHSETGTEGGYWAFQDSRFISPPAPGSQHEQWSYQGLHVLEDGDRLTILSPDDRSRVVWTGVIKLRQLGLFKEDAGGLWIHADQEGVDRKIWSRYFFKEYPAKLVPLKPR